MYYYRHQEFNFTVDYITNLGFKIKIDREIFLYNFVYSLSLLWYTLFNG